MPGAIPEHVVETIIALRQSQKPPISYSQIAEKLKLDGSTVAKYAQDPEILARVSSSPSFLAIKKGITEKFYRLSNDCLDLAGRPEKMERMSSYQLVGMSGILHQNARLAGGESTQNIGIAAVVAQATKERVEKE